MIGDGDVQVDLHVVGDAFVDLFCFLESVLPESGGDALLEQPIKVMAGGSAINTCTHLTNLVRNFSLPNDSCKSRSVDLQTALNPNDEHGTLLLRHAQEHGFQLYNRLSPGSNLSTGHCVVIIARGERSFMTHRGCIGEFGAERIDVESLVHPRASWPTSEVTNLIHYAHIHIPGYYNLRGFWGGRLKKQLERVCEERKKLSLVSSTTISLVPQHDATGEWDGQILDLVPLLDFLILNELEADSIMRCNRPPVDQENENGNNAVSVNKWASFFNSFSSDTCVIVTRGSRGAVALQGGDILATQTAPQVDDPVDPTGAGDAFAAGFIHGIWTWKLQRQTGINKWPEEAVQQGLAWGCGVGTCCVMTCGASVPAPPQEIKKFVEEAQAGNKRGLTKTVKRL